MTSTMSAAQLFVLAIVAVLAMSAWLALVFLADRQPSAGHPRRGAAGAAGEPAAGGREVAEPRAEPAVPAPRAPADAPVPGADRGGGARGAVGSSPR